MCVDGSAPAALCLGHHPESRTPERYAADTGVECALRFLEDPSPPGPFSFVTNDHYDADGVLSAWALLEPEAARHHRELLVAAAECGDYAEVGSEEALQVSAALAGILDHRASPLSASIAGLALPQAEERAYEFALSNVASMLRGPDAWRELWGDEHAWWSRSLDAPLSVTELAPARLGVVESDDEPHPAVLFAKARGDLVLLVVRKEGGYAYRAEWRPHAWARTVRRPPIRRTSLEKLCLPLNALETNRRGRWMHDGYPGRGRSEALAFVSPGGAPEVSTLEPTEVVGRLAWFLVDRRQDPPATNAPQQDF